MKNKEIIEEAKSTLHDLDKLLTERISDLHEVPGGMQARHAYCYYRKFVWDAVSLLKQVTHEKEDK